MDGNPFFIFISKNQFLEWKFKKFLNFCCLRFDGKGKYDFSTGTKYDGELKDGMMHGKGTLFFENGGKYEATWDNGIATEVFK